MQMRLIIWICLSLLQITLSFGQKVKIKSKAFPERLTPTVEKDASFWYEQAQLSLRKRLNRLNRLNKSRAKNIIFFLGDGMSISTITAARILKGQRAGHTGEETKLNMEDFPYTGLSKVYCANAQTPDSACTATAYLCGAKANLNTIGVNAHVKRNNCTESANKRNQLESIAYWAQLAGKSTGIITTTTVTHASPAAAYAHIANRNWESDAELLASGKDSDGLCMDIAKQLIEQTPGCQFDVILGGGMRNFLPENTQDAFGKAGKRLDGNNLIEKWQSRNPSGAFISTRDQLMAINATKTKRIFGTFNSGSLEYNLDSASKRPTQPRLKEMTAKAIELLQKNSKGYFAFIEGGRIDHGHHATIAGYALDETIEFDEAIATAVGMTKEEDTLIIVTADHAHPMSIVGYPGRGSAILRVNKFNLDADGIPYNILNYAMGSQQYYDENGKRVDLTGKQNDLSITPSYIRSKKGEHSGDDVAIFARGPQSHLFSGVMEQSEIPHLLAYAACIGHGVSCAKSL